MSKQNTVSKSEVLAKIEERSKHGRLSAWRRGVYDFAVDMVDALESEEVPTDYHELQSLLLNGARDWSQYSYGGCALIYDEDIARALCTPSELKRKRGGELPPNSRETWLDVQTRALFQACNVVKSAARAAARN